jgi:signal transduction histidine kinase
MSADIQRLREDLAWERRAREEAETLGRRARSALETRLGAARDAAARLELFRRVADAADSSQTPAAAFQAALEQACFKSGWPVGHVYLSAADGSGVIEPSDIWHPRDGVGFEEFREATMGTRVAPGQGLVGRAWTTGRPQWMLDAPAQPVFERARAATRCGIRGALAVPVVDGRRSVAVLELFARKPLEPDGDLLDVLALAGAHLGRLVRMFEAGEELREREEDLRRSAVEVETYALLVARGLREPLDLAVTSLGALHRRFASSSEAAELLEFAAGGARRMTRLLEDFVAYARLWAPPPPPRTVFLSEVVLRAAALVRERVLATAASIRHESLPVVRGDLEVLVELFRHLFDNAIRFRSAAAPQIHVEARRQGASWLIGVRDNGVGIDPRFHDQLFWLFRKLDRTEGAGSGLGLASCRRIVERHGGRIWVDSEVGKGATFWFSLPALGTLEFDPPTPVPGRA